MGSSLSKVSCADINIHKKYLNNNKPTRRMRIDKSQIGIPTDFRHTYHVGNNSPISENFPETTSLHEATSILTDTDFLATMAQISDALQKFPLAGSTQKNIQNSSSRNLNSNNSNNGGGSSGETDNKIGNLSIQQIVDTTEKRPLIDSSSMVLTMKNQFSEKEKNSILQIKKSTSVQHPMMNSHEETKGDGHYNFSSCLQSRIDAQIIELARVRSKHKHQRSPVK